MVGCVVLGVAIDVVGTSFVEFDYHFTDAFLLLMQVCCLLAKVLTGAIHLFFLHHL